MLGGFSKHKLKATHQKKRTDKLDYLKENRQDNSL